MTLPLVEKYRPTTLDRVVGQPKAVSLVNGLLRRGIGGRALWLSGPSGTGKTTIAKILAAHLADDWGTDELDAASLTPKAVADWERQVSVRCIGKGGWALLVNEAHGLRKDTVRQLLVTLERLPPYAVVIFTTTNEGQQALFDDCIDAHPLMSRCVVVKLQPLAQTPGVASYLRDVAQAEGLDGRDEWAYRALVGEHKGNLRACLQAIDAGQMLS